jgi:hypothetical protein
MIDKVTREKNWTIFSKIRWPYSISNLATNYVEDMPEEADRFINRLISDTSVIVVGLDKVSDSIVRFRFVSLQAALETLPNLASSYNEYQIEQVHGDLREVNSSAEIIFFSNLAKNHLDDNQPVSLKV